MVVKKVMVEKSVPMLHQAEELINGERQRDYGDKLHNFSQIAAFWNAHLKFKLMPGHSISAEDVALMMINVKQARLAKSPDHADSILDVAGYAGCYDKIREERSRGYESQMSMNGAATCASESNPNPNRNPV